MAEMVKTDTRPGPEDKGRTSLCGMSRVTIAMGGIMVGIRGDHPVNGNL